MNDNEELVVDPSDSDVSYESDYDSSSNLSITFECVTKDEIKEGTLNKKSMSAMENVMTTSEYAQVIFHDVEEVYQRGFPITVNYMYHRHPVDDSNIADYVGMYRVGWLSPKDCICIGEICLNQDDDCTNSAVLHGVATFKVDLLPNDSPDFYQFVYITDEKKMRGASTPFQIRNYTANNSSDISLESCEVIPHVEEFDAIEDPIDESLMVVRSRLDIVQGDLIEAEHKNAKLQELLEDLKDERDKVCEKLDRVEGECRKHEETLEENDIKYQKLQDELIAYVSKVKDTNSHNERLQEKITFLNQEIGSGQKRLDDSDKYICSLQEKIKRLVSEKDALTGHSRMLEQEKQLIQNHISSIEVDSKNKTSEVILLKSYIDEQKVSSSKVDEERKALMEEVKKMHERVTCQREEYKLKEKQLKEYRQTSEKYQQNVQSLKVQFQLVCEQLQVTEDKLSAALNVKKLLEKERSENRQLLEKAQQEYKALEAAKVKLEKHHLEDEKRGNEKLKTLESINKELSSMLEKNVEEIKALKEHINSHDKKFLEVTEERDMHKSSLFSLMQAHEFLQNKLKNHEETAVKQKVQRSQLTKSSISEMMANSDHSEGDLMNELKDAKVRLHMGKEEYKKKYLECTKLKQENIKLKRRFTDYQRSLLADCENKVENKSTETITNTTANVATTMTNETTTANVATTTARDVSGTANVATIKADEKLKEEVSSLTRENQHLKEVIKEENEKFLEVERLHLKTLQLNSELQKEVCRLENEMKERKEREEGCYASSSAPINEMKGREEDLGSSSSTSINEMNKKALKEPCELCSLVNMVQYAAPKRELRDLLIPLPPPIRPQRLPSAKVASVKAAIGQRSTDPVHATVPFFPQAANDEHFEDASDHFIFDGSEVMNSESQNKNSFEILAQPSDSNHHQQNKDDDGIEDPSGNIEFFPAQEDSPQHLPPRMCSKFKWKPRSMKMQEDLEMHQNDKSLFTPEIETGTQAEIKGTNTPMTKPSEQPLRISPTLGETEMLMPNETVQPTQFKPLPYSSEPIAPEPRGIEPTAPIIEESEVTVEECCPICNITLNIPMNDFIQHVDNHYGLSCPVCNLIFKNDNEKTQREMLQDHINSHFDD